MRFMVEFYEHSMEFLFLIIIIVGIFIALLAQGTIISYIIIFLSGMFAGRLLYERRKRKKMQYTFFIIIAGFVIGFLIGAYYANRAIVIILFAIGAILSYKLFDKKILRDIGLS